MKLTQQNTILLITITGIIALGLMTIQVWIGLAFALIPAGIILALKLQNRRARPQVTVSPFAPPIKTVVSEFEITQAPRPADTIPVPVPVARTFAEPLLAILRTSGHDLDAPVILGDNNAVLVTARDIVVCIAEISKEKQDSVQELTKLMPAMYSIFWNYTGEAARRYGDLELIKLHIASSAYFKVRSASSILDK